MFTFVTNATERVAAMLVTTLDPRATVRHATSDIEDVTVVSVHEDAAARIVASFRRAGWWTDRLNPPVRERARRDLPHPTTYGPPLPVVGRAMSVSAASHVTPYTVEMDSLMRKAQRRG